jgi:hypothetical protein
MVLTGSCVCAPARPAFVSPSPAEITSADLTPATRASGPHAFAVRVHVARLATLPASIASQPAFVAIATRPLWDGTGGLKSLIWGRRQVNFCKTELLIETKIVDRVESVREIGFSSTRLPPAVADGLWSALRVGSSALLHLQWRRFSVRLRVRLSSSTAC